MNKYFTLVAIALFHALAVPPVTAATAQKKLVRARGNPIANEYLVCLDLPATATRRDLEAVASDLKAIHKLEIALLWSSALKGFYATMPEGRAIAVSQDKRVKFVEENHEWSTSGELPTNLDPAAMNPANCAPPVTCPTVPDNRLWHLDRIGQNVPTPSLTSHSCTTWARTNRLRRRHRRQQVPPGVWA